MTDIPGHLPHRYPFLLVDRVLLREPGMRVVAEKLVTAGEPHLQGHLPDHPLVPGVLLLEMLAQTAGFLEAEPLHGRQVFLAGIQDARFQSPVHPGDRLRLEVTPEGAFGGLMRVRGTIRREGTEVCTARLTVKQP